MYQNELNNHASKKEDICEINKPFMIKALSKSIIEKTRFRNLLAHARQIMFGYLFLKKQYFANLNENKITDNRKFWQTKQTEHSFLRKTNQGKKIN